MPFSGSQQLRAVSRDLRAAGTPARGLNSKLRRGLVAAMAPMVAEVRRNAFNIPATGDTSSGLRVSLMRATRARIATAGRNVTVGLIVDGKKMPQGQEGLPGLMEGERRWRHPLFGDTEHWYGQKSHPFVGPAIPSTVLRAEAGVNAAIRATQTALTKGTP